MAILDTTVVRSEGGGGLYLHPVLVVDPDEGAILGLAHASFLGRDQGRSISRRDKPVAAKESQRWLNGVQKASEVCAAAAQVTVIADLEGDIFAAFAAYPPGTDLLVRAAHVAVWMMACGYSGPPTVCP